MKRFLFQLKTRWLRPGIYKAHQAARARMRQQDLPAYNLQKRQELVAHAREHSPFYRERYAGLQVPGSEAGFQKLPVITREDLRGHFERLRAGNVSNKHVIKRTTSGTTGPPLSVLQDQRVPLTPLQWRLMGWWGVQPWEDQAFVYRKGQPRLKRWLNHLLWWPTRRVFLESPEPKPAQMDRFIRQCRNIRPALLQGYVDLIYELALYIKDHNIAFPATRAVWVTAGPLTQTMRNTMEAAFGAPVYDQYGGTESYYIAAECRQQQGLHILQDVVHVEVLDEQDQPLPIGQWGKIVITDLHNRAFPLIRYEIGDYGRLLPVKCACNRPLPLMDAVKGRLVDCLVTPLGRTIHGNILLSVLDARPGIVRTFQWMQREGHDIEFRYVPQEGSSAREVQEAISQGLEASINEKLTITAVPVTAIPKTHGKQPWLIHD